jgi:putative aldouronate transport system permease protein
MTNSVELLKNQGFLWRPKGFTMGAFGMALDHPLIVSGYKNIMFIMIFGLALNILMTLFAAVHLPLPAAVLCEGRHDRGGKRVVSRPR